MVGLISMSRQARVWFLLAALLIAIPSVEGATATEGCPAPTTAPVVLPLQNVTLGSGTSSRGINFSVGTPPQEFAFSVDTVSNITYLYDGTSPCNASESQLQCATYLGGIFNEGASSTWSSASNLQSLGLAPLDPSDAHSGDLFGTDTIHMPTNLNVSSLPLGIWRKRGSTANTIGLGHNSTVLNSLLAAKIISARVWALSYGWAGAKSQFQIDGSLSLGGYDHSKITGPNLTTPYHIVPDCESGMLVSLRDVTMGFSNGSASQSLVGKPSGTSLQACVDPSIDGIAITQDMMSNFIDLSGSTPAGIASGPMDNGTIKVLADGAYDGNLTVSIYQNCVVQIPNHQLVVPDFQVTSSGQETTGNKSEVSVLLQALPNGSNMLRLGRPFLSSVYLLGDNEEQSFTIWPSDPSVNPSSNLIAVGPPVGSPFCSSTAPASPSPSATILPPPGGTSAGTIAGATVGAVAGVAILAAAAYLLWRRRRRSQVLRAKEQQAAESSSSDMGAYPKDPSYFYGKHEMQTDNIAPQELPLKPDPGLGVAPYEMSGIAKTELPDSQCVPR